MKSKPRKKQPHKKEQARQRFFDLLRQGTQALQKGEVARAVRLLARAHRLDQENADAALNLGGAYILSKKFTQAVAILEPLSEREPDNPMVWTNLGAACLGNPVLARDEDQRRAIAAFERAIELDPAAPNVAYNLGLIYWDRREGEQALTWFRRAVRANPNDQHARRYVERLTQKATDEDE
jgi:Flp pilus assembly protein TadD